VSRLLEVEALEVSFGAASAVRGASLALDRGETLCLVGESGCGKSVTALAVMGLLARNASRRAARLSFDGQDLRGLDERGMSRLRGNRMAMIFQEPMTSLNPAYTVGEQIVEGILRHQAIDRAAARARAIEMLRLVRIPAPEQRFDEYPHKLSGGMRQRAMIAMALACGPRLLIADEPTTALDVTIQAQILDLLRRLREETGTAIILITHDLGVIAELADDVVVMYAGQIVERAPVRRLFEAAQHPYTIGLLGAIPELDRRRARLATIEGTVPDLGAELPGCRFAPRCPFAQPRCRADAPSLREVEPGHEAACWRAPLGDDA